MPRLSIVVLLSLCNLAIAQQPTDDQLRSAAASAIVPPDYDLTREIRQQIEAVRNKRVPLNERREQALKLENLKKSLREAKKTQWEYTVNLGPELPAKALERGQIGTIVHFLQMGGGGLARHTVSTGSCKVFQVIDKDSFLVSFGEILVMVAQSQTRDLADEQTLPTLGFIYVTGNVTYDTKLGPRTVMKVVPLTEANRQKYIAMATPSRSRTWTDVTGKHTTNGELLDYAENFVTLKKDDGGTTRLHIKKLSKADRQYVEEKLGDE